MPALLIGNVGFSELLIILLICLLVFGANRLPQIGEGIGKAISGLKRGLAADENIEVKPVPKSSGELTSGPHGDKVPGQTADAEVVDKKS